MAEIKGFQVFWKAPKPWDSWRVIAIKPADRDISVTLTDGLRTAEFLVSPDRTVISGAG